MDGTNFLANHWRNAVFVCIIKHSVLRHKQTSYTLNLILKKSLVNDLIMSSENLSYFAIYSSVLVGSS